MALYADILSIEAPATANLGQEVVVKVDVKNLYTSVISIKVTGTVYVGGIAWADVKFLTAYVNLDPGHIYQFGGSFTMPSNNVWVTVISWWYGADGKWHSDDVMAKEIKLPELVAEFSEFKISSFSKV